MSKHFGNLVVTRHIGLGGVMIHNEDGEIVGEIYVKRAHSNNDVRLLLRFPKQFGIIRINPEDGPNDANQTQRQSGL